MLILIKYKLTAWPFLKIYVVSYTHLRANETGLDVGCRPLLEKKKNNPKNYKQSSAC